MSAQTRNLYVEGGGDQYGVIHTTTIGTSIAGIELLRGNTLGSIDWRILNDDGAFKLVKGTNNFSTTGFENLNLSQSGILTLPRGSDAEADNNNGVLILGNPAGINLAFDNNEILARNNAAPADLLLQHNSTGDVGIGATLAETTEKLTVQDDGFQLKLTNSLALGNDWYIGASNPNWTIGADRLTFDDDASTNDPILLLDGALDAVGISTNIIPAGYKLAVDGKTICEEVTVDLSGGWPDYVFAEDYNLISLAELEATIQRDGHLPNVPSAETIEENGLSLGEMQRVAFEKIEELTLYMIQMKKENDELRSMVEQLLTKK